MSGDIQELIRIREYCELAARNGTLLEPKSFVPDETHKFTKVYIDQKNNARLAALAELSALDQELNLGYE